MEARELRIGNLVRAKSPEKTEWVESHKISAYTLYSMVYPRATDFVKPDIEPIQLSEEWLLKFGYRHSSIRENHFIVKGHTIWLCDDLFICDRNGNILKHVHQLQNLYFALTGEELEITKTK
jgi:hypothetical protein